MKVIVRRGGKERQREREKERWRFGIESRLKIGMSLATMSKKEAIGKKRERMSGCKDESEKKKK